MHRGTIYLFSSPSAVRSCFYNNSRTSSLYQPIIWMYSSASEYYPLVSSYEHDNESSVSSKGEEFVDKLTDY
jgi:hypothetical protein